MIKPKGFTLIELLVVIAIIAVLMGILMPTLRSAREQGRRAVCLSHVKSLITGIHVYAMDNDDRIPDSGIKNFPVNASWTFIAYQAVRKPHSYMNLGLLYGTGVITDPEILYCPAQKNPLLRRHDQEGWGWSDGASEKAISYMYGLCGEVRAMKELEKASMKLSQVKQRALVCDTFIPFQGPVWAHTGGLTTGYGAGHVEYVRIDKEVIEASEELEATSANDGERDKMDLFAAVMFELLSGKANAVDTLYFDKYTRP